MKNELSKNKDKDKDSNDKTNLDNDDESSKNNKSRDKYKKLDKSITSEKLSTKLLFMDRFEIESTFLLGKGSFGEIYISKDLNNKNLVAIKLENQKSKQNQLRIEKQVLELMSGTEGIPKIIAYGNQHENNFLVMDLLGPNLNDLFELTKHKFSLQTVLLIGIQILTRIKDIHSKNYIHRDIKPENFLIGMGNNSSKIYCIDFGLSKKYKDSKMDNAPYKENKTLIGTARYASINNHLGIEQSRRDDLESIAYLLIFFIKKKLPWQGCRGSTKQEKYNKILEKKLSTSTDQLCKDLPIEFSIFTNYVKNLKYNERPDYIYLLNLLIDLLNFYYSEPFIFDWCLSNPYDEPPNLKRKILKNFEEFNKSKSNINDSKIENTKTDRDIYLSNKKIDDRNINNSINNTLLNETKPLDLDDINYKNIKVKNMDDGSFNKKNFNTLGELNIHKEENKDNDDTISNDENNVQDFIPNYLDNLEFSSRLINNNQLFENIDANVSQVQRKKEDDSITDSENENDTKNEIFNIIIDDLNRKNDN